MYTMFDKELMEGLPMEKQAKIANKDGSRLMKMDKKELVEHAKSKGIDALKYLLLLSEEDIFLTDQQKEKRRIKLREKTKSDGTPRYTPEEIEERLSKPVKRTVMEQRVEYCKKYWPEMVPNANKSNKSEYHNMLQEAIAELSMRTTTDYSKEPQFPNIADTIETMEKQDKLINQEVLEVPDCLMPNEHDIIRFSRPSNVLSEKPRIRRNKPYSEE